MRAILYVLIMILAACTGETTQSSLEEYDGGPLDKDSEILDSETEPDSNQGKDSEEVDSDIKDSEPLETDSEDSDNPDTDTLDTEEPDTETEEPEPCVFSEKDLYKCEGNTAMICKEDPNSSTIELIWQTYHECPVGTFCEISTNHVTGPYPMCTLIGECRVGTTKCSDNNAQVLECVLDGETGGGYWAVQEKCVAQGLKCWPYGIEPEPRCVPEDWVYCGWLVEAGDFDCIKNYIVECSEDYHWKVLKNCSDGGQTCGEDDGDWICYDKCEHLCAIDTDMCEMMKGTVVYNAGECLNDTVCCKPNF